MALTEDQKTALNFKKFLAAILPYIGGGGGHTIKDSDDTEMTKRAGLKFSGDLEVSDDSENDETEVAPHRLTSEELADICSPLPASTANLPVLFDESGAEYVVGRYVNSQGKWKPVYQKTIIGDSAITTADFVIDLTSLNIDTFAGCPIALVKATSGAITVIPQTFLSGNSDFTMAIYYINGSLHIQSGTDARTYRMDDGYILTIQYTKTTDTYQD